MTEYMSPTKAEFNEAEATLTDVMTTQYPSIQTKAGSVVRELVVRPLSYLYSWCMANLRNLRKQYSVAYLKTSQATDNEIADLVASNWFITRKSGKTARGVITLTITSDTYALAQGSIFEVGGTDMHTEYRIVGGPTETYHIENGVLYTQTLAYGTDTYIINIPIVTTEPGAIEIAPGAPVELGFPDSLVVDAQLTSAVTDGSDVETDAQMMARAESNTAEAGIGSWYAYKRKLDYAPVEVLGMGLVSGDAAPMRRGRYNTINVNIGGYVDCYVKTQTQASTGTINNLTVTSTDNVCTIEVPASASINMEGFYTVSRVVANGTEITNYTVEFTGPNNDPADYRLSPKQAAIITFADLTSSLNGKTAYIEVAYMPGLAAIQQYLNGAYNKFVGQDVVVKAAVPANIQLSCIASSSADEITDDIIALLKKTIADTVNSIEVGTPTLNFSDIRLACHSAVPNVELRLPCIMIASVYNANGGTQKYYSDTGIMELTNAGNLTSWSADVCFFSLIQGNIRIEVV